MTVAAARTRLLTLDERLLKALAHNPAAVAAFPALATLAAKSSGCGGCAARAAMATQADPTAAVKRGLRALPQAAWPT